MSNKYQKKIRQLVRRSQGQMISNTWDIFFETVSKMPLKLRIKLAWKIIKAKDIRKVENGISNTGSTDNSQ